ncbi:unnamed protein product [Adineta steineri]|uniref:AIG1-type G domain-containing protein n=1 Tax=Adineta steineri TaxID=433720 RepID=A0A818VL24_9BILA|nr:unnamed protein product [Adineta steineri]CAF3708973.1 unnamed protein product [Adineta steineri]
MYISKRVVLIGPAGAGKSWLGNELLKNRQAFQSSASTESVTAAIHEETNTIILKDNKRLILTVVDTPGVGDTKGRSHDFMDHIVTNIKTKGANMLLIVLPYGRLVKGLKNNLLALKECINGFYDLSTVLIINQMPSEYQLQRNNPPQTLGEMEDKAKTDFADILKMKSSATNIFIQTQTSENVDFNNLIENMYDVIVHSTSVSSDILRTWTETLNYYEGILGGKTSAKESFDNEIARKRDRLARLEQDQKASLTGHLVGVGGVLSVLGLICVPVVGQAYVVGTLLASGATATYYMYNIYSLEREIQNLHNEIVILSDKTPNAQEELEKAKAKLEEICHYL